MRRVNDKKSEKLEQAKKCIDSMVKDWNKTTLSDLEKYAYEEWLIWGAVKMALYFLNFDDYNKLKKYIYEKYGYDAGGMASYDLEEEQGNT